MKSLDDLERAPFGGGMSPAPGPASDPMPAPDPAPKKPVRDARVDVLRGLALLTIFIDHIPRNAPALYTLHNFGFSDAAEIFVLLAGYSSMVAYGGLFARAGTWPTLARIARRCLRIYLFQAGLLLATLIIVRIWMDLTGLTPRFGVAPLLQMGLLPGLLRGLALNALPNYLDILPLYILLLALFPVIYFGLQRGVWGVLALSGTLWLAANVDSHLNLPNAAAVDDGWYFNPFAWQFLFVIGAALARRRISRQTLAEEARISLSTLEKALAGRRPFTLATTIRLEEALGQSLRQPTGQASAPELQRHAPDELGAYAREGVSWLEGRYLTLRPSFETAGAIFAYRTEIAWDAGSARLVFREAERVDAPFAQSGSVAVPSQSGMIYLVTN